MSSSSASSSSEQSTSFSTSYTTEYVTDQSGRTSATSSAVSSVVGTGGANGNTGNRSNNNVGPIVGGVIGGLAGLALLGVLAWFLWKRNKKQKEQAFDEKMFDPAHRYSRADPLDLVGGGANEPFTHGAGAAGGAIEPFPYTNPSSPQNMSQGLSHDGYAPGPGSSSAHGAGGDYGYSQMSMPDARNYAQGGGLGWGYGGDGYATAAGVGAGAAAGAAGAAGIGAFNNRHQPPQHQQGYSGYDYRSETTSQSGDSQYPPSSGHGFGMGMTPLTPAAIAKQREAQGGSMGRMSHQSRPSWGQGQGAGPSGSGGYGQPMHDAPGQGQGPSSPTSQGRPASGVYSDEHQPGMNHRESGVFVHRDMEDVPESTMPDELPPVYNPNRSSQS